jgi:hypothetical protein
MMEIKQCLERAVGGLVIIITTRIYRSGQVSGYSGGGVVVSESAIAMFVLDFAYAPRSS